jgi:hypothetical protein
MAAQGIISLCVDLLHTYRDMLGVVTCLSCIARLSTSCYMHSYVLIPVRKNEQHMHACTNMEIPIRKSGFVGQLSRGAGMAADLP